MTSINDLIADIKDDLNHVEKHILAHLNTEIPLLNEVAQYILDSGGKRLRPAILIIAAKMFNFEGEKAYQAAAAVEYLHTATLLHDDVVDDAELRRSRVAARKIWGNQASVLVGDYLLATSFRSLTLLGDIRVLDTISSTTSLMAKGENFTADPTVRHRDGKRVPGYHHSQNRLPVCRGGQDRGRLWRGRPKCPGSPL